MKERSAVLFVLFWLLAFVPAVAAGAGPVDLPAALSHIEFSGGDGASCEEPVVVVNAQSTSEGNAAQNAYLKAAFPQARIRVKALTGEDGKYFEVVEFSDGAAIKRICFDISGYFGT